VDPFLQDKLGDTCGDMVPDDTLVANGFALADPARTKILNFYVGVNDNWDSAPDGANLTSAPLTGKLTGISPDYTGSWYDPRTGAETSAGTLSGDQDYSMSPPSTDDWILLLNSDGPPVDSTPPSTPSNLVATPVSQSQIDLTWTASTDAQSGVSTYRVFRSGSLIGQSATVSFSDTGLAEGTAYTYEVSAVNGTGLESAKSAPVSATTMADVTPPFVVSVQAISAIDVDVTFSEPVEQASATEVNNYAVDNGIIVSSATLLGDLKTVRLVTTSHVEGVTYTLTVNNVRDIANSPNTIAANAMATYTFLAELSISNLAVATGKAYEVVENGLDLNNLQYIDRTFTFSDIPTGFQGLTYIKTANDDKSSQGNSFLSFDVNQDVTVYVAHRVELTPKPSWLLSFADTGLILQGSGDFNILKKDFPAGTITLGGNIESGTTGRSMYTVILEGQASGSDSIPPTVSILSPSSGSTISGAITISASASDNVGVSSVQFKVDAITIATDTTNQYSVSWDTTTATDGPHTLTAVATDSSGNSTTSSSVAVTVSNGSAAPAAPTNLRLNR